MAYILIVPVDKQGHMLRSGHVPTRAMSIISVFNSTSCFTHDAETTEYSSESDAEFVIVDSESINTYKSRAVFMMVVHYTGVTQAQPCELPKVHAYLTHALLDDSYSMVNDKSTHVLIYKLNIDPAINQEYTYFKLLESVLAFGHERPDRTGTGTISMFSNQVRFDISKHIPLLTTKSVPWKMVIEELLWFMRGETDSKILEAKNINIWKGNTSREFLDSRGLVHLPEGDIGCGYGFQWRHFGGKYVDAKTEYGNDVGFDQLQAVIDQLKNDPYSRRIMMTAWNAKDLNGMALPPCHNQVQFYVTPPNGRHSRPRLSCHMYQRSVDTFLGFPFNIMSYATLTYILAMKCDMVPNELIVSTGDTHIYKDHLEQVRTQLQRNPLPWAMMQVDPSVKAKSIETITIDDFQVYGYFSAPSIKAKMAI